MAGNIRKERSSDKVKVQNTGKTLVNLKPGEIGIATRAELSTLWNHLTKVESS